MRRYSGLVVMLACMAIDTNLYAQQATDAAAAGTTQQAQPEKHVPPAGQDSRQAAKPAATFTPSEKISADSAISFPVDI
jgi:hypothetical protein